MAAPRNTWPQKGGHAQIEKAVARLEEKAARGAGIGLNTLTQADESPSAHALRALDRLIEDLDKINAGYESRLGAYLGPPTPLESTPADPEPVAPFYMEFNHKLDALRYQLAVLRARLDRIAP